MIKLKPYFESLVMDDPENNVFSDKAARHIANDIMIYVQVQNLQASKDIPTFEKELSEVQLQINNIVSAIANGMFHTSMKEKMDELELGKNSLLIMIQEAKREMELLMDEEMIVNHLKKNANIKSKSPDDQKKIIQTYVTKVCVSTDYIDIELIVGTLSEGGRQSIIFTMTKSLKCFASFVIYQSNMLKPHVLYQLLIP